MESFTSSSRRQSKTNEMLILTTALYNSLLFAYLNNRIVHTSLDNKSALVEKSLALLQQMKESGVPRDNLTNSTVVKGLCYASKQFHKKDGRLKKWSILAYNLYQKSPQLRNSAPVCNHLLLSLCHIDTRRTREQAIKLKKEMDYRGGFYS